MPRGKAYSSFNISGEGSTLPKSILKEYADSATRPLFQFLLLIFKKIILNIGLLKKASLLYTFDTSAKTKINIKTEIMGN